MRVYGLRFDRYSKGVKVVAVVAYIVGVAAVTNHFTQPTIPLETYSPLLEIVAKGESNGNYSAYFGNGPNTEIRFTEMTIREVSAWQAEYVRKGSYSSAVGRYQIINTTLAGLVKEHDIGLDERFDEAMQDRLAIKLLERRGSRAYFAGAISREQFAANLAQEWAALPKVIGDNPERSYYADDGVNKSRVSIAEILGVLASLKT
jgi:conjugal transfer mating pair stabilization protein TraG